MVVHRTWEVVVAMDVERWRRVKEIYSTAMERAEPERSSYISESCSDDPELADEIRRLVNASVEDDFLEDPSSFISEILPGGRGPQFAAGDVLAKRFVIRRFVARGGMGEVYAAFDNELREEVALKTVRPEIARIERFIQQFKNEVQRARIIGSEYVCRVYDLFTHEAEDAEPQVFLTMELLEGETLAERISRRGAFDARAGIDLLRQVSEGLAAAHREGVVHGDLKPSNIMLAKRDDGGETPKITDFGLAAQGAGNSGPVLVGAGTPAFMAPEQLASGAPSKAADLYSFGLIALRVFGRKERPADPKAAALRLKDVPGRFRQALAACLEWEAQKRPESAESVAVELEEARTPFGTRRVLLAGLLSGAAATVAGVHYYPNLREWAGVRSEHRPRLAVIPFMAEGGSPEYFAAAVTEEISMALARGAPGLVVIGRDTMSRYRDSKRNGGEIAAQLKAGYVVTGGVRRAGGRLSVGVRLAEGSGRELWSRTFEGDERQVLRIRDEAARELARRLRVEAPSLAQAGSAPVLASMSGHDLYWQGRYFWRTRTDRGVQSSIEFFQKAVAEEPGLAEAHAGLADGWAVAAERGLWPAGVALAEAKKAALAAVRLNERMAEGHVSLAQVTSLYDRDYSKAEDEFRRALALEPDLAAAHQWYGYMLAKLRRFGEAELHARRALESEPLSVPANANLATKAYYASEHDTCISQCRKVMALEPALVWPRPVIALVFAQKGLRSEAEREWEGMSAEAARHPLAVRMRAEMHGIFGEYREARALGTQLAEERTKRAFPASWVASAMAAARDTNEAYQWMERAFDEYDAFLSLVDIYPSFATVRSDPRYHGLLVRLGLRRKA
ncbi:MAG: protein kinase [Bryobacteraceae bacterium]|nr:protein kinase [Bryobacteraceae bacterium]